MRPSTMLARLTLVVLVTNMSMAMAKDVCGASGEKYFDDGLIFHLSKAGVPYKRGQPKEIVCVDAKFSAEFGEAERELERHFHEIAYSPRSKCEESALIGWATKEGLRFETNIVLDEQRKHSGIVFFLRSFTYDEVVSNRTALDAVVRGVRCPKMAVSWRR